MRLAPVTGALAPVVTDVTGALAPVVTDVTGALAPVTGAVAPVVSAVTGTPAPVTGSVPPVVSAAGGGSGGPGSGVAGAAWPLRPGGISAALSAAAPAQGGSGAPVPPGLAPSWLTAGVGGSAGPELVLLAVPGAAAAGPRLVSARFW